MLQLQDLPTTSTLRRFAARYPDADIDAVLQFLTILRIGTDLSNALDAFLDQRHGLLQGRWWVLILLMREEDLTSSPSELAAKSGVTRATMTGLLEGLMRERLVERLADATDGRRYRVRLTAEGQAKLDVVMPDYYRRVKELMLAVPAERRSALVDDLRHLKHSARLFTDPA